MYNLLRYYILNLKLLFMYHTALKVVLNFFYLKYFYAFDFPLWFRIQSNCYPHKTKIYYNFYHKYMNCSYAT